jgi:hypothetical protein
VIDLIINLLFPCFLLVLLLFLVLRRPRMNESKSEAFTINDFLPRHHLAFQEVQQRLAEYNAILRETEAKRRDTAIGFLNAIRGDFLRLQHLLTRAAKFVPELTVKGEAHRFWLGFRFRLECRLAHVQILLGLDSSRRLGALTVKLRLLADRADKALNEVARHYGLPVLESDLNS